MAKASVSFALESLVKVIVQERELIVKAGKEVESLRRQLEMLIVHIQKNRSTNAVVITAIKQIKDAAQEAEDLITSYAVKVARYGSMGKVEKAKHGIGYGNMRRDTSKKVEEIKNKIDEILQNKTKLETYEGGSSTEHAVAMPHQEVHAKTFINFTRDIKEIKDILTSEEPKRHVITIFGMRGSGKTALAMKLCQDIRDMGPDVFKCVVFVTLKQRTSVKDILCKIISTNFEEPSEGEPSEGVDELENFINAEVHKKDMEDILQRLDEENLKHILSQHLQNKRYLVVIDNVWDYELRQKLLMAFPDDSNGSRIVITTCYNRVVNDRETNSTIHFVPVLKKEDGSQLFCRVVFDNDTCPPDLEHPKNKVLDFSHGLPIVIVELGKILAKEEKNEEAWNKLIGNGNSYPDEGTMRWRDKFALSYEDLEVNQKLCLFYFGSFPANYEIPVRQLIQLWIAEEFIPEVRDKTLEQTAEMYLEELIHRCLIKPLKRRMDGGIKTCRIIHDVLRDVCLYESMREGFLEVLHDRSNLSFYSKPRRISLHRSTPYFINHTSLNKPSFSGCNTSSSRSLLCFSEEGSSIQRDHLKWLCKEARMLRVLKFGNEKVESIPKRIRKLYLLKYLKLQGDQLTELPDSICDLLNLVTLDLRGTSVNSLPDRIWKLHKLRHLYMPQPTKLPPPSDNSITFECLQIFSWLSLDKDTAILIAQEKLPQVMKLGLYAEKDGISLNVLKGMKMLKTLKIKASYVQSSFHELESLNKLTFVECEVNLELLEKLPNLEYLKVLKGESVHKHVVCGEDSFAKLRVFQMTQFTFESWNILEGAMDQLFHLIIEGCANLKKLPDGLQRLTMLKEVHVHHPYTEELARSVEQMNIYMGNRCDIHLHV